MASRSMMAIAAAYALLAGCGGDDRSPRPLDSFPDATIDPDDPDQVTTAASLSAPRAFAMGYAVVAIASIANGEICTTPTDGGEPVCMETGNGCPALTETADGFIVEGSGCMTEDGDTWTGRIVARGLSRDAMGDPSGAAGAAEIVYEGLTIEGPSDCPTSTATTTMTFDGRLDITPAASGIEFDLDLELTGSGVTEDCNEVGEMSGIYEYHGTRVEEGGRTVWGGSGRFGNDVSGLFEASTEDEVLDMSVCSDEALSGATTVTAGSDVLVFTYDGETDCDEASTVTWTFDGADRGELEGVQCAAAPFGTGSPGAALALGLILAIGIRRRRRAQKR